MLPFESLEELLTSELGFGLTQATPLQRACCWVLQGAAIPERLWESEELTDRGELWGEVIQRSFGNQRPSMNAREIVLLCGIRGAKTLISAATCVWKALTADLSDAVGLSMREGERPAVSLVSRNMKNAREAMNYIAGAMKSSWILREYLVGEPLSDSVVIQHPSGVHIVVNVIAMSSTGVTLVSRWCVSVLFDEAPRMASEDEGKINLPEQVRAIRGRILPGGVILYVGSPYGAKGYVYDLFSENWQKKDARIPICCAYGFHMNPSWWTPERVRQVEEEDPDTAASDIYAKFRDPEEQLYSQLTLSIIFRESPMVLPYDPSKKYTAAMDPGTSKNAWTLVIGETADNRRFSCAYACEWRGTKTEPLSPKAVLTECKQILDAYNLKLSLTDQYAADANKDIARDIGFDLAPITITGPLKETMHKNMHSRALQGLLSLPPIPEMRRDFIYLKRRLMTNGTVKIITPETQDGRHCDYASACALLFGGYLESSEQAAQQAAAEEASKRKPYHRLSEDEREDLEDRLASHDWLWDDEPNAHSEEF